MNTVLHIDVAKVNGDYTTAVAQKYELSADGPEEPKIPLRIQEVTYGSVPQTRMAYIPIFDESVETVFGPDWKELDFIVDCCPNGSVTAGDLDDPDSTVSKLKAKGDFETLPAKYGASAPNVYYSNLPKRFVAGILYDPVKKDVVMGAMCTLTDTESGEAVTVETDSFGGFSFRNLADDRAFTLKLEKGGTSVDVAGISTQDNVNLGDIALA